MAPDIEDESPTIFLTEASPDELYTLIMDTGDRVGKPYGPIVHHLIMNVKGSDLGNGISNLNMPSSADVLIEYYRPNPPIPYKVGSYSYAAYRQLNGKIDFSGLETPTMGFNR